MPKQRQTCTRCSMRRQKCDRKNPCSRCVQNKEAHLCTMEWSSGYNAAVHRKYPRKSSPTTARSSVGTSEGRTSSQDGSVSSQGGVQPWPTMPFRPQLPGDQVGGQQPLGISYPAVPPPADNVNGQPVLYSTTSTNVDFITYGREYADVSMGNILKDKEAYDHNQALMERSLDNDSSKTCLNEPASDGLSPTAQSVEVHHLQSLLPTKEQVLSIVDYHGRCMAWWIGGFYHRPSFQKTLEAAYEGTQDLNLRKHDWRWSALLFSILAASMIGSDEAVSNSWGFSEADKLTLSRQWGSCMISCLHLGDYASNHHIYSIQAILNMHTSEHLVGSTKKWAAYQAAATVIARGLGLHKLAQHPEDHISPLEMQEGQKEALLQREIGRRVWSALTSQDWLCSTSQGMYYLQKRHYTSILPRHFDEETLAPIKDDNTPSCTLISNFLNEVGYMLSRYLDDMLDAPDLSAKYNVVLRYDAVVRALTTEKMPRFLRYTSPYNEAWPQWALWARRSYQASAAHKVIMIHQSFLGKSFRDPRYTYSRWACLTSSNTIIDAMEKRYPEEPQWWVEQAFVVTAGLCLGLDLFHRTGKGREATEDKEGVERAIKILQQWPTSSVAHHGIHLLSSLLQEHTKKVDGNDPEFPQNIAPQAIAEAATASTPMPQTDSPPAENVAVEEPWVTTDFDVDMLSFEHLMGMPMDTGLDNNIFFENMLGLSNPPYI
ncbi:hypothetical protein P280DRAFT_393633 [Massarina eburnea CBS 473.64]|uniref:Zn(2)-C6 fungal-type domain-containing protein n=1 Tax=Massarina eburnea CBS 473.64 TaxID=1395130 RepID=A0A6A6S7B1_9PLEO|nr:hypothetical protein P280DRAFT_393633 [Massarina eburnea CBS 473.64]